MPKCQNYYPRNMLRLCFRRISRADPTEQTSLRNFFGEPHQDHATGYATKHSVLHADYVIRVVIGHNIEHLHQLGYGAAVWREPNKHRYLPQVS